MSLGEVAREVSLEDAQDIKIISKTPSWSTSFLIQSHLPLRSSRRLMSPELPCEEEVKAISSLHSVHNESYCSFTPNIHKINAYCSPLTSGMIRKETAVLILHNPTKAAVPRFGPRDGKTSPRRFGSVAARSELGKGRGCHGDDCPEITSVERPTMHCRRRRVLLVAVPMLQKMMFFLSRFVLFSSTVI